MKTNGVPFVADTHFSLNAIMALRRRDWVSGFSCNLPKYKFKLLFSATTKHLNRKLKTGTNHCLQNITGARN